MATMRQLVDQHAVDPPIVERRTPMLDVGGFLTLAVGSGFVSFVGVGLFSWAVGLTARVALGVAGVVVLVVLCVFMVRVWQAWFQTETVRQPGQPQIHQVRDRVEVEVSKPDEKAMQFLDLPGTGDQLGQLARGVLAGRSFSEAEWSGGGRPYARSEFRELRGELLARGLLEWRNDNAPAQGVQLTAPGRAVFRRIAQNGARTHAHARGGGPVTALLHAGKGRGWGHG